MSCPDWKSLDAQAPLEPAIRQHTDGCDRCRREALRRDPTLVFRRLPAAAVGAADIAAMKRSVAAMRRGRAIERGSSAPSTARETRRTAAAWPRRLRAAVVATAVLGASYGIWAPWRDGAEQLADAPSALAPTTGMTGSEIASAAPAATDPGRRFVRGPLIENVGSFDEVIEMAYDDLDLVVVIDSKWEASNLDV